MKLTVRGWALAAVAWAGLLAAFFSLNLLLIAVATFAVAFVLSDLLAFARIARTLARGSFRFERTELTERLVTDGLGIAQIQITHPTPRPFYADIYDSVPDVLEVVRGNPHLVTWWGNGETLTVSYAFRALGRGAHRIGPTEVRVRDALGLAYERVVLPTEAEVRVSPVAPEVALRRSSVRHSGAQLGDAPAARHGYGTEFRSLRPYLPSDDYRSIAWRRSQPGQLFVREFEQESRQDFLMVVALGRELQAGRFTNTALDRACEAGILLNQLIPRGGDRFGIWLAGADTNLFLAPGRGGAHGQRIEEALTVATARGTSPELDALLRELSRRLPQPTHVLLFAPTPEHPDRVLAPLSAFRSAGHRVYTFAPDFAAMYPAFSDPMREFFLARAEEEEHQREAGLRTVFARLGVPVYPYGREGAAVRILALYQQIHQWGIGR